jgi:hypothetical protein
LNIPFNIKISGATMGDLRNGATIAITLIGGAN